MSFSELLSKFPGMKATVVGDLMLDEYLIGNATRISPEAPVMVVKLRETKLVPGGAANVARNVVALGAKCHVVGVIGADEAGKQLEAHFSDSGVQASMICDPGRATTKKTRVLADSAHQVLRIDVEDETEIGPDQQQQLCEAVVASIKDSDVLILSDYLKGTLVRPVVEQIINSARSAGVPIVVNPKPRSAEFYQGAGMVSLNRVEASEFLQLASGLKDEEAGRSAALIRERLGTDGAVITLGASGMVASGNSEVRIPAPKVEVYDTAGAGDTVVATLALGYAAIGFEEQIFRLAAETSAAVVRKVGVAVPSPSDLAELGRS